MRLNRKRLIAAALLPATLLVGLAPLGVASSLAATATQSDSAYAASYGQAGVTNVAATTQKTSCYTPEAPFFTKVYPDGGMTVCGKSANTGENLGPYATQAGSNPGYPASSPMLVKEHSESDIRVDPTNANHVIGTSKWFVSAEGYNHLLGFFESFDGGQTWPVQGHIPGYEGWTDNTDPVGAFDSYGNFYVLQLPYQFYYNSDGSHNYSVGTPNEPNPSVPAEAIGISVRPHGATSANGWITTHAGHTDFIASYDATGREPDKQWITIDTARTLPNGAANPNFNNVYAMWVVFDGLTGSKPYVSVAKALPDGTHTDWSAPLRLPTVNGTASDTYLLPHVDPSGVVWTTVTNFPSSHSYCCANISVIYSTDAGKAWQGPLTAVSSFSQGPYQYPNTTFRSGIIDSFGVGSQLSSQGRYPLYVAYEAEDTTNGVTNIWLTASYNGGQTWTSPVRVNDNASPADEFQPNLNVFANGTVGIAFYDRRLACPTAGTQEANAAGLAQDTSNPNFTGALPPYGAKNYCMNSSIQFFSPTLARKGQNVRLSAHTWDPQLNSPHVSSPTSSVTFLGDYFGITGSGQYAFTTSVSTYNYGQNKNFHQQQVVAKVLVP